VSEAAGVFVGKAGPAPPPPAPGSKGNKGKGDRIQRSAQVIKIFHDLRKKNKDTRSTHKRSKSSKSFGSDLSHQGSGGDALIKELEMSSKYFAQIQSDVETHGPSINKMIQDIHSKKWARLRLGVVQCIIGSRLCRS